MRGATSNEIDVVAGLFTRNEQIGRLTESRAFVVAFVDEFRSAVVTKAS